MHLLDPFVGGDASAAAVSTDWDEIRIWSEQAYMPYRVPPSGSAMRPRWNTFSTSIGELTLTRFRYGIPVTVDEFSADAGNILVLTTVRGRARHRVGQDEIGIAPGGAFVVDWSRIDHDVDFDDSGLQLNLTVPQRFFADHAYPWCGSVPDDRLWQHKCVVGSERHSWNALLAHTICSIRADPNRIAKRPQLEDMLLGHLLSESVSAADVATSPSRLGL